jgi:hypothetical protein
MYPLSCVFLALGSSFRQESRPSQNLWPIATGGVRTPERCAGALLRRLPPGRGPLLVASLVATLSTGLAIMGHGEDVPQVVAGATAILAIFVGRPGGAADEEKGQEE